MTWVFAPRTAGLPPALDAAPSPVAGVDVAEWPHWLGRGRSGRVAVDGRHLAVNGVPFRVRGATYGSFRVRGDGEPFPEPAQVRRDFALMDAAGLNAVRTYAAPPEDLLDLAAAAGLRVLAGLHYEDWRYHAHPGRRTQRAVRDAGRRAVDEAVARGAGRPEVLALSVGNEVPADLVRLHGAGAVEEVLSEIVAHAHAADPDLLLTYTSYPTTEYLSVEGIDLACFNIFLEQPDQLRRYLRHLQVAAGEIPLLITELGLASRIHGEAAQADSLEWQLREVDEAGCAGAMVFSWTDEWWVNGTPVDGWGFGITDENRNPKPSVETIRAWTSRSVKGLRAAWPSLSVVVCAYNEERTIQECLLSLRRCDYPDLEVIVCDDGSTDRTAELAARFPFRVLQLDHGGLSRARNEGIVAARGSIVAFLDADATCHPDWPYHLALSLEDPGVVGTGGPNLPFPRARFVERVVAGAPGGPVHVLCGDDRAEHVPGCNMAFRKEALTGIGGFDAAYVAAGDDVDVCWKLIDGGGQIAFSPAAQVLHHRRGTVRGYLRQQRGYGRAERMVSGRHRHRFNGLGQARWSGFIYGGPRLLPSLLRPVVYHGYAGAAPFQTVVRRRSETLLGWWSALLPLTAPLAAAGAALAVLDGRAVFAVLAAAAVVAGYAVAVFAAVRPPRTEPRRLAYRLAVTGLWVLQPFVRAWGRLWARPLPAGEPPGAWNGDRAGWLRRLRDRLAAEGWSVAYGGSCDAFDLSAARGPLVRARVTTAVLWGWTPQARVRVRPRAAAFALMATAAVILRNAPLPAGAGALGAVGAALLAEAAFVRRRITRRLGEAASGAWSTGAG